MRYAKIKEMDISNGTGIGVSIFFQGCNFHCDGCFNPETWNFNGGKEWIKQTDNVLIKLIQKPYISRVSFLGGEPLDQHDSVDYLSNIIKKCRKDIKIWMYTGYKMEYILDHKELRSSISNIDIIVDGQFVKEKRNMSLKFRGSSNQRIVDVQKTLDSNKVVLYIFE